MLVSPEDRKSTRLNSSHSQISYAVFCLKKKQRELVMNLGIGRSVFQRGFVQADCARKVARSRFALCIFELLRVPRCDHSITAGTNHFVHEGQNEETHRASDNHSVENCNAQDALAIRPC